MANGKAFVQDRSATQRPQYGDHRCIQNRYLQPTRNPRVLSTVPNDYRGGLLFEKTRILNSELDPALRYPIIIRYS